MESEEVGLGGLRGSGSVPNVSRFIDAGTSLSRFLLRAAIELF